LHLDADEEMAGVESEVVPVAVPAAKETKKIAKVEKKETKKKVVVKKTPVSDDNESESGSEDEE